MATTPRPTSPRQPQRRRSAWLAWSVCGLSVALVLSLVAWADSFSWAETPLHDSGIWVTNGRQSQYGRVNKAAGAIDGVLLLPGDSGPTGSRIDVLQDGATVVVRDLTGGRLLPVDAAAGANLMTSQVALPPTTVVDLAGGVLAAVDSRTGEVRLTTYDPDRPLDLTPLDPTSPARLTTPLSGVSDARVDLAVGLDGVVHVVSSAGLDLVLEPDDSEAVERQFAGAGELTAVAVTLVGDQPVVADPDSGRLWLPGGQVVETPNGVGLKLQRPSGPADAVWLATVAGLVRVGLYDGRVEESPAPLSGATTAAAVAEPVVVADCALGAWAGSPGAVLRVCPGQSAQSIGIDRQGELLEPVFRVNRSLVVLNDVETGRVFDLERGASLDFWSELQPPDDVADQLEESRRRSDVTDPEAVDDLIGARPGRVTVAHVLDNDSDAAGQVLVVSGLDRGSTPDQVGLTIAPDGQTIHIDLPDPAPLGSFSFGYEVFNGVGRGGAQVTVEARGPDLNSVPQLRPGATTPVFPVASFGSLALPVLGDWRDPDGDAVSLTRATWAGGPLPVTGDGQIRFVADRHDSTEQVEVTYWVSDGRTESEAKAIVHLLGVGESHGVAPVGFPDVVRAQVSAPVKVFPLSNDMVGADPAQPGARLALQGSVLTPDGVEARTDLASGLVELTAQRPGSYQLDYTVGFGSAPFGHSVIRLDVSDDESLGLTAVPDQVAVRGQVPVTVDVLANDWDPRGSVLTVVRVEVDRADQLRVAVVDGRWVRVMPLVAELAPNPAQVRYVVTDGQGQTASGLIQLTQLPAVADGGDVAVVNDDWARVRVGDQVLVPVLGNDASVSGLPLVIDDRYVGVAAGELSVVDPSGVVGRDVGRAFVVGDRVLYVAPEVVDGPLELKVEYRASTASGLVGSAVLTVQVTPEPTPALPGSGPAPGLIEARSVWGDTVVIPVDPYGVDPDGDSVLVSGLVAAPRLGRVLELLPTGVRYQSFPSESSAGTDEFQVLVSDRYGRSGFAVVRVGLTGPGQVQPPVAVDDVVTAEPGARVSAYPMSNDLVGVGDRATVAPLEQTNSVLPDSVRLDQEQGLVRAVAPQADQAAVLIGYALAGGAGTGPAASLAVRSQTGYQNPPRLYDHVAEADGSLAGADVLDDAWDIDGETSDLRVVDVTGSGVTFEATGRVSAAMVDRMRSVVFVVEDGSGARSAAVLFVPAAGVGGLGLVSSGEVLVDRDSSVTVDVNDYVESPRGTDVRITLRSTLAAAPASALSVEALSPTQLQLTARNGYVGPGSITMELMDAPDSTDPEALTGTVTIPVQVGDVTPVLRCPAEPIEVVQGGRPVELDVAVLCHVWMPDPAQVASLRFEGVWANPLAGVSLSGGGPVLSLQAAGVSRPGSSERLVVSVTGFEAVPGDLVVTVVEAPPPSLVVSTLTDVAQGSVVSHRVQVVSPLVDARPALVSVRQLSGLACGLEWSGTELTLSPGADSFGPMVFEVVATDLGSEPTRVARQVSGVFTMVVYGRPEAPSAPLPGPLVSSHGVGLAWSSGADHGAAVEEFELVEVGSGRSWSVGRATRFDVVGLPNGVEVCFQVRARNRAGWSDFSAIGPCQTPNEAPGRSPRFEVVGVGDGTVLLEWEPAPVDGTPVTNYRLVWPGGVIDDISGAERRIVVSGLDNYTSYVFALTARNGHGWSESTALAEGQPSGRPTGLDGVSVSSTNLGHEVQLALSWPVAQPNGPGPVTYQVTRWGGADVVVFPPQSSTSLVDQVAFDGSELTYQITASNATGGPDHTAGPVETYFHAISPPAAWEPGSLMVRPTGRSGEAVLELEVPPSHGGAARIELIQGPGTLNTPQPNGGRHVQTISGFIDGVETAVQIRLCNELGQCSDSSVGYVTTFGQLATPTLRVWQHGSYGDHLLCAEAQVQAMGADASLTLRASNGSQAQPSQGPGDLVTEFCADAGGPELALTFTASVSSGPTTPARSNPTPATAQIKTPKDPTPPLAQPTLTTRQGGVGDTEVCATAHGHGNGHPARLYLTNDRDSVSTAPVSGSGALNSAEQCFDPGRSGVAVVFTAHLETDPTDPPRTDAPTGSVTLVSSAQPLQPPAVQARAPGSIGDYRVCASAQGDGQGTPAKLYLTSSNGATSAAVSGSGALAAPEWCVQANPAQTITFTAHLDNDSAATPRPDQTATANATAPDAPPPFAKPTITVRAASNNKACFTASAAAGDYPAQLTVSNSKNSQTWVTGASSGNLSLSESCVDAGSTASVTFTATLTSQVAGRADASASATLKMPRITASKGGNLHDNVYYIRVTTSDLPRSVTCKLTDSTYVHDFTSTISLGPNDSGQTNSRIEVVSGVWVKVRCWGGDFELTSGQIPIK